MQDRRNDGNTAAAAAASSKTTRPLQPLAPRHSRPSSASRDPTDTSDTARPPRLSHRSRAGCWTCRGRKVKCDENREFTRHLSSLSLRNGGTHAGAYTSLCQIHAAARVPDSIVNAIGTIGELGSTYFAVTHHFGLLTDHRLFHSWNFSDATTSTKGRYSNINTSGNAVWDPSARQSLSLSPTLVAQDDLPEFAVLTSDEDRERKAVTQRPGTYGVVVTPESFHDLPEYAATAATSPFPSRRTSTNSSRGGHGSPRSGLCRSSTLPVSSDQNTVILDKFEELSPTTATAPSTVSASESRRSSRPEEAIQRLSISTSAHNPGLASAPMSPAVPSDDHLVRHFRQYIAPRLCQPQQDPVSGVVLHTTSDVLEREAARFPPLHHAICAISALNLSINGRASLGDALEHYGKALAIPPSDLLADGVFFRHMLLFVYDICVPGPAEDGGTNMWASHLNTLRQMATDRHQTRSHDRHSYSLWAICQLDMYACLMGSGNCEFVQTITRNNMIPPLELQIPPFLSVQAPGTGAFHPHELQIFPTILHLNEGIILRTAKLAQQAQAFRTEVTGPAHRIAPSAYARWQATTSSLQHDLHAFWEQTYPMNLGRDSIVAAASLPSRVRTVFENATLLYHAATIYSRTSMFPGQRRIPMATQLEVNADTDGRAQAVLRIAARIVEEGKLEQRQTVFPLFMAGFATKSPEVKRNAIDLIKALEGSGIGQNTYRTRQLLVAVCEEQARSVAAGSGRRLEDVEWLVLAREKGLTVVNCGL